MKLKDIAKIAGVSPSTISKIVNGKDTGISADTRDRVLKIVREYHYTPYASATASSKTWTIGVILRSYVALDTTLDGIIQTAQDSGYGTFVLSSYDSAEQEIKNISALTKHKVDGIIWEPVDEKSSTRSESLEDLDLPLLKIGIHGGDESLLLPYEEAAYKLTEELLCLGHKNIGCLLGQGRRAAPFLAGYRKCLFDNNIPTHEDYVFTELDDRLISSVADQNITGFISSNYRKALEFHQLLDSLRYRIPADVSLISLSNDTSEILAYPGSGEISTYSLRNADFGSHLCKKLVNDIEKRDDEVQSFVQEFHLDNTTSIAPPPDTRHRKAIVVGSINIDNYLKVPHLPNSSTPVSTRFSTTFAGGKGVNEAVGMARLGHRVTLIGNVGSDSDADFVYRALDQEHVDTSGVSRSAGQDTGKSIVLVDRSGESIVSVISGANATLSAADLESRAHLFTGADCCLVQTEIPLDAVDAALQIARENSALTIVKPTPSDPLTAATLQKIDILVPNRSELSYLIPGAESLEEKCDYLQSQGVGTVIVTLGSEGCYLHSQTVKKYFPPDDTPQIDATGAGDAFVSALASYLLYRYPIEEAVQIAIYAAGHSVAHETVVDALIDRRTLENRIAQAEPQLLTAPKATAER